MAGAIFLKILARIFLFSGAESKLFVRHTHE
jgi:hypothetical protein